MFKYLMILTVTMFAFNVTAGDLTSQTFDNFSGSTTYFSDGSTAQTFDNFSGSTTYFSNGSTAQTFDNFSGSTTYYYFND